MKQIEAFSYCLRCGAKAKQNHNHLACPKCGLHYYLNAKPFNIVVIRDTQGKYLLVERAYEPLKGYWDFPGGFTEEFEDFDESAIREVKEELGIEVKNLKYLLNCRDLYEFDGISYGTVGIVYTADLPVGAKLEIADDVAGYKFFSAPEIPYGRLAFSNMPRIIKTIETGKN